MEWSPLAVEQAEASTTPVEPFDGQGRAQRLLELAGEALGDRPGGVHVAAGGLRGCVLIERGRICWVACSGLAARLTDTLGEHAQPPLDLRQMEAFYRACQTAQVPLGEALVLHGHLPPLQLESALRTHTCLALSTLCAQREAPRVQGVVERRATQFDLRFSFAPGELLADLARRGPIAFVDAEAP